MRIDVVSIFPAYLDALQLSLVGKAAASGLVTLAVHDLREVTTDRHRTVDDTPVGGGAGMVMRPDVWGKCLDGVLGLPTGGEDGAAGGTSSVQTGTQRRVLAVPTPAGRPLTQAMVADLARADQLVIACGRYEGIDSRVPQHYATTHEVVEYSIGDYVLNGGEVAALALIEAVVRLLPGVVGNPASLVEESHGEAGLLEYPVFTRPLEWRGIDVPAVLLSGDHGRIERWRRDQALQRTAQRRPDMLARLDADRLNGDDKAALAAVGWCVPAGGQPMRFVLRPAVMDDAAALAALAAQTFPLACPAFLPEAEIREHISTRLTEQAFAQLLGAPGAYTVVATPVGSGGEDSGVEAGQGPLLGYAVVLLGPDGAAHPLGERQPGALKRAGYARPAEFYKCYVAGELIGSGLASALIAHCLEHARAQGADALWLGTHEGNKRAQRAYKRHGFKKVGKREFMVGAHACRDVVMACPLGRGGDQQPSD